MILIEIKKVYIYHMSIKSKVLLFLQFASILILLFNYQIQPESGWMIVEILGFLLSFWGVVVLRIGNFNAQPEVKTGAQLIMKGPYRFSRNPIYSGLIIFFGASIVSEPSLINLISFSLLTIVLILKIKMEESFLEKRFGKTYTEHKKKTFALIPLIW